MKHGDTVKVRRLGGVEWNQGEVLMASDNQESIALIGDDLPMMKAGMTLSPFGKTLLLLKRGEHYAELTTGEFFEVYEIPESKQA